MNRLVRFAVIAAALCAVFPSAVLAQSQSAGSGSAGQSSGTQPLGNHMGQNNMTQEQFNQMSDYVDQSKRLTKEDRAKGKTEADLKAEDEAAAADIVKALPLPCAVSDAQLYAKGSQTVNGKAVASATYEVACANGTGYFVVSQAPLAPYALSCFTADAKRAADAAKGQPTGAVCKLPANADVNAAAAAVLDSAKYRGKVMLTGLGTPDEMKKYVKDGTVKSFELWNPADLGYLAAYAAVELASGSITGAASQTFTAGKLGKFTVGADNTVLLGAPYVFNAANINNFNF